MFTGLIQTKAKILNIYKEREDKRFVLSCEGLENLELGESIAINGVCLSVEEIGSGYFKVFASKETLSKTNLNFLKPMDEVNVERSLRLGDKLGGHIVTGHVDCLSQVKSIIKVGESYRYTLTFPEEFSLFVVEKGSIALDGISLTVNRCGDDFVEVNIIPITYKETNISSWKIGTLVNTEFDIIGKYVAKMINRFETSKVSKKGVSLDLLKEHGFI